MIGRLAVLILLSAESLIQTAEIPPPISLTAVKRGDDVTLACLVTETQTRVLYLYKQRLGHMIHTVVNRVNDRTTISDSYNNSRFTLFKCRDGFHLTIKNVTEDDEASYFCQNGTLHKQTFSNGTFLAVKDQDQQTSVFVKQSPESASVHVGDTVHLQCSLHSNNRTNQCPGEHSVHWFRAGSGPSHPGLILTNRNRTDERRTCVFRLSQTLRNSSDAGTYYCVVVTCGEILFGEGTKLETRSKKDSVVLVLGTLLACCVTLVVILVLFLTVIRTQWRVCEHCKGAMSASHYRGHNLSTLDPSNNLEGEAAAVNYVTLDFPGRKPKRVREKSESPHECLYASTVHS